MFDYCMSWWFKVVNKTNKNGGKATERHAAIAANLKKEEEFMKNRLSDNKARNKTNIKKRRSQISELPKEERPTAKEELRKFIEETKAQEIADKETYRNFVNEKKVKERTKSESPWTQIFDLGSFNIANIYIRSP